MVTDAALDDQSPESVPVLMIPLFPSMVLLWSTSLKCFSPLNIDVYHGVIVGFRLLT